MAHARYCSDGLGTTWPLLTELAWLSLGRFASLVTELCDPSLNALRRKFDAQFEGAGQTANLAWFPGYSSKRQHWRRGFAKHNRHDKTSPERATRLLLQTLDLERQCSQHNLVDRRKALHDLHPGFYATYMKTR